MEEKNGDSYGFGRFRLDLAERLLTDLDTPLPLTPKAFDVLAVLVRRAGHLVEKEELMEQVWPDSFVEEANVARIVHKLRKTLGDDGNGNSFIQTVPTKGYRFVAPVTQERESEAALPVESYPLRIVEMPVETEAPAAETEPHGTVVRFPPVRGKVVRNLAVAAGAFGVVLVIVWFIFSSGSVAGVGSNEPKSIAVLPVRSLTEQNRDPIYEFGIAESLIARLGSAKNLTVRQLDAVRKYGGLETNAIDAGKEQRVNYVLASNYQIVDQKMRVTSQLINVSTGAVEDVFKFDADRLDPFAVQDAAAGYIGNVVLNRLGREVTVVSQRRYTANEEAYRKYQLGTTLADSRDPKAIPKAIEYFEQAVQLDPNYALAYTGLANAHTAMSLPGEENGAYEYFKAKEAIERALELDDTLSEAHTYLAELKWGKEWDFAGAESEFRRGIELNPYSAAAHRMYALMLGMLGRTDEAVIECKTAIDLEPASVLNHKLYVKILYHGRRYDDAIAEGKLSVDMAPNQSFNSDDLIDACLHKGEYDQAFEWFVYFRNLSGDDAAEIERWKKTYSGSGWTGVRAREIDLIKTGRFGNKSGNFPPMALARLHALQGENDRAFEYIEKAFAVHQWGVVKLKTDPDLDRLRGDPRFDELLRRANMK